ncbi:hypothetical protein HKD37_01G000043 [Glycine soja]
MSFLGSHRHDLLRKGDQRSIEVIAWRYDGTGGRCCDVIRQQGGSVLVKESWVFEHLPPIPPSEKLLEYDHKKLLTVRWLSLRGTDKVVGTRALLDQLQMIDVIWSPYASCKDLKPFKDQTSYSGYIRIETYM